MVSLMDKLWLIALNEMAIMIFSLIPVSGVRKPDLTTADGLDDGPDYSPDGKNTSNFNSARNGNHANNGV